MSLLMQNILMLLGMAGAMYIYFGIKRAFGMKP